MFDHMGIVASELAKSRAFYEGCLGALGIRLLQDHAQPDGSGWLVFGTAEEAPFFVVEAGGPGFWRAGHTAGQSPVHVAFTALTREAVDRFHDAGLASGGVDHGAAGLRHSSYAAYLIDPDGNNVEARHWP